MTTTLDLAGIRKHWQNWADLYGTSLRATTKVSSAKYMELNALVRTFRELEKNHSLSNVMEVGCGNGQNCFELVSHFSKLQITGIDYIPEMISAANIIKNEKKISDSQLAFAVGDVLNLTFSKESFDVIFTDRCLINLNTDQLQQQAIKNLIQLIKPNGYLLMIENSQQTYAKQNRAREMVGLPKRTPAEFNHFFDEETLLPFLSANGLEITEIEDFITFHDLVLYVLIPMINGGEVDYQHPLVEAAATLNTALSAIQPNGLNQFGQNRFYKCRKLS